MGGKTPVLYANSLFYVLLLKYEATRARGLSQVAKRGVRIGQVKIYMYFEVYIIYTFFS